MADTPDISIYGVWQPVIVAEQQSETSNETLKNEIKFKQCLYENTTIIITPERITHNIDAFHCDLPNGKTSIMEPYAWSREIKLIVNNRKLVVFEDYSCEQCLEIFHRGKTGLVWSFIDDSYQEKFVLQKKPFTR